MFNILSLNFSLPTFSSNLDQIFPILFNASTYIFVEQLKNFQLVRSRKRLVIFILMDRLVPKVGTCKEETSEFNE